MNLQNQKNVIGFEIFQARKARGLKQSDVAKIAGIGKNAISEIENGKGNPTIETLIKIFKVVGLKISVERGD